MSVKDVFKKSFMKSINTGDISTKTILITLAIASVFALYLFFVYRFLTRKTFYDKSFNISLPAIAIIVASIIITIQSSLVVSLGMVGALSIVRFRTAIKNPMDLVYLFWAIAIGIICGAGLPGVAFITSLILTAGIIILDMIPVAKIPLLLVVNADGKDARSVIIEEVNTYTRSYTIKSQTLEMDRLSMIIEIRTDQTDELIEALSSIETVSRCSLLSHDGEVTV